MTIFITTAILRVIGVLLVLSTAALVTSGTSLALVGIFTGLLAAWFLLAQVTYR